MAGILTLNLDRFATRAFAESGRTAIPVEFHGRNAAGYAHVLKGMHPFVGHLHGMLNDKASWVFTKSELSTLLNSAAYRTIIDACLTSKTVLFLGISADDVAAGGHLARLAEQRIDTGDHFWLTSRRDAKTDAWAEAIGLQVIRYSNDSGTHAELDDFFRDLKSFVPQESPTLPVVPRLLPSVAEGVCGPLPGPAILAREDDEAIRQALNSHAAEMLNSNAPDKYDKYDVFWSEYETPIYRAWHVSARPPVNELLGYKLIEELSQGAFGTVFRAEDRNGKVVAIKVLKEGVRSDREMLQGFRRGVASMKILSGHNVEGVVACHDAAEIPTFVVMDMIEGPNLQQARESRLITEWDTVLNVGLSLTKIIRKSHSLPERVLHRDIRPANVMLENGWLPEEDWKVFDYRPFPSRWTGIGL